VEEVGEMTMAGRGRFSKPFTRQEPIPEEGVAAAAALLRSGRLHRYEAGAEGAAAALERRFAEWQGARFCLAVTSGGQAMQIALRAAGVRPDDRVLTNAWTLAPVPGAIACVGAEPVLVETTEALVIDLEDLAAKARASGARVLLLSHMRGHVADMDTLTGWAEARGVTLIEDCAHTMGAEWRGRRVGSFGAAACFSTQAYKHLNSGEGGLLTTDDDGIAARATVLSGSYMLFDRHGAGPEAGAFADAALDCPNGSARMDELRAAILLPQLGALDANLARWEARHALVAEFLAAVPGVALPEPLPGARRIGSSIQFRLPGLGPSACAAFVEDCAAHGVALKWFGGPPAAYTFTHTAWRYVPPQELPRTDAVLAALFDMRLPLTFTEDDCRELGALLARHAARALREPQPA
jgi:dTDP-4-amino-4,6-dideoxygalactose transaminase